MPDIIFANFLKAYQDLNYFLAPAFKNTYVNFEISMALLFNPIICKILTYYNYFKGQAFLMEQI
jgi:hypothetical protein